MDTHQERRKDLDKQACRTFVCPNLALIDEKGKELELKDTTIKRTKDMAIEYFKKTYQTPHYSSAKNLLPAFMYMASIIENDRRTQWDVEKVYKVSSATIRKWYKDISGVLNIKIISGREIRFVPNML
jgi:transcription initiation factor TFIIIB Brf1 subunit/transcription initiation factor TFIIB